MRVNHTWLHNAFTDGGGHAEVKNKNGDNVEEGGKDDCLARFEHPGRNHRGNGVGSVVKAVHEVEQDGKHHQHHDDPQGSLYSFHK